MADEPDRPTYPTYPSPYDYGGYPPPPHVGGPSPVPPPPDSAGRPPGPASTRRTVLAAAAVAAVVGGGIGAGTVAVFDNNNDTVTAGLSHSTQVAPAVKVDGTISAAAAKIGPSVVTINVATSQEQDTGSGVIIRSDGYILTNNHVIANGSSGTLTVTLKDGRTSAATVVGTDPSDDLAVIKIGITGLTAASFASSASLVVGQTVVAIGAPLGLSDTVTAGIVSNIARPVQTGDTNSTAAVFNAVQTDAAINPGNSGGPLVNLAGDVVGINAAIATDQSQGGLQVPGQQSQSGNIGIGFAIPSDEASRIAAELIATGKATHALMGVSVGNATSKAGAPTGATVKTVTASSPAAKAGLKVGDVVTKLDEQRIDNADALVAAVRSHAPKDTVSVTYQRGGSSHTVRVTLGSATN
jgi:putative serine protease PepD